MTTTQALAPRESTDLAPRFVVSLDDLKHQLEDLERFKREIMVPDVDYGVIPGTNKPTLLKPGAEKLALAFGLAPIFTISHKVEDWEFGFFHYETRCDLVSKRTGEIVASAHGSANSKETRYRWRDAKPACQNCGRDLRRSKPRDGDSGEPGWYCWQKMGGCGATYPAAQITVLGRIENPEPYELVNTLVKMSEKRSLVATVLIGTGGSGTWTQDLEDLTDDDRVIEVPIRERDADDKPRNGAAKTAGDDIVRNADSPLWKRWLELRGVAEGLGIAVQRLRLPQARKDLVAQGKLLSEQIAARRQELAFQDSGTKKSAKYDEVFGTEDDRDTAADAKKAEPSDVLVDSVRDETYQSYLAAVEMAQRLEVDYETVTLPIAESALKEMTTELSGRVRAAQVPT